MRRAKCSGERIRRLIGRMRRADGSASLEFLGAGLLLLLPLVYLVLTLAALQSATLAAEGAARHAARVYVQSERTAQGERRAEQAVLFALADHGIDPETATVKVSCRPSRCLDPGTLVTVEVTVSVPLPFIPAFIGDAIPLNVPVVAAATQEVSRFAGAR